MDLGTVDRFGLGGIHQDALGPAEQSWALNQYSSECRWGELTPSAEGFDLGRGSRARRECISFRDDEPWGACRLRMADPPPLDHS
jgi:hypothetical protein